MNYKEKYYDLKKEVDRLKLQMRSKETIIKVIIKKLRLKEPYNDFINNLRRINFDYLLILEDRIK